jgi:hypothetical protein
MGRKYAKEICEVAMFIAHTWSCPDFGICAAQARKVYLGEVSQRYSYKLHRLAKQNATHRRQFLRG